MKKFITIFLLLLILHGTYAQQHSLRQIWETDTTLKVPESVCFDARNKVLYVSNIDGMDVWAKDGKGSIARVGLDGKILQVEWIKGLNGPKGMGLYKNMLYVADVNEIAVIDIEKNVLKKKIPVPYAEGLNDITIDPTGVLYVSDSKSKRVYIVKNEVATPFIESGLQNPNGLLWLNESLFILDKTDLIKVEYDRKLTKISSGIQGGADGLVAVTPTEWIASGWAGMIYYIYPDGTKEILLDTKDQKMNTADITFDPATQIVYVPTFWKNKVVAYELK